MSGRGEGLVPNRQVAHVTGRQLLDTGPSVAVLTPDLKQTQRYRPFDLDAGVLDSPDILILVGEHRCARHLNVVDQVFRDLIVIRHTQATAYAERHVYAGIPSLLPLRPEVRRGERHV